MSAGATSTGPGGNLTIDTGRLDLRNGSILVGTVGTGDAGRLQVNAGDRVLLGRSTIFSGSFNTGNAGNLNLTAPELELSDGSLLSVATALDGTGAAGSITLDVGDRVRLSEDSQIAATTDRGDGGNVALSAGLLELRDRSLLSAASRSSDPVNPGNGGNLSLSSDLVVLLDDSQISANAQAGNGGNIAISTQGLYQSEASRITASSAIGLAGVVDVSTPDIDSTSGLVQFDDAPIDPNSLQVERCGGTDSQFTIPNRGGIPEDPMTQTDLSLPPVRSFVPSPIADRVDRPDLPNRPDRPDRPTTSPAFQEASDWSIVNGRPTLNAARPWTQAMRCLPSTPTSREPGISRNS